VTHEIGSNALMGCEFKFFKGEPATSEQEPRTPFPPIPGSSAGGSSFDVVLQDQSVGSILIGYNVLMITNLNDLYT